MGYCDTHFYKLNEIILMVQDDEMLENEQGAFHGWPYLNIFVGGLVAVIILVYGVIRVKKAAGVTLASKATVYTVPSDTSTDAKHTPLEVSQLWRSIVNYPWLNVIKLFLRKIPTRLRNFYIKSFLIPRYRKEWGKYRYWCFRSPARPHRKSTQSKSRKSKLNVPPRDKSCPINVKAVQSTTTTELITLPKPVAHNHAGCRRIRINVGGCIYETQARTLSRFPETLLGDPNKRLRYYNPANQEYFFDRNRAAFQTILYYYQSGGRFKRPSSISADILLDDAKFYGLPESVIYQYLCDEGLSVNSNVEDVLPRNLLMRKIWLLFDYPGSSLQAKIVSLISVLAITLSITTFCIETLSSFVGRYRYFLDSSTGRAYGVSTGSALDPSDPFYFTESICSIWFLVEYLMRFACSPVKKDFLLNTLNIIDLIAVLPYFVQIWLPSEAEVKSNSLNQEVITSTSKTGSVSVIRVVRLVRVFRIFKLSHHSRGLKILGKTLQASFNELILLIFFILIGVILFSSTMYFAELGTKETHFPSIPDGFWWALITITTVGYGDNVPKTDGGKIVGALCAVAGVLTLALPVPVIVSNFNFFYHQSLGDADLSWIKINHSPACPFRPTNLSADYVDPPPPPPGFESNLNEKKRPRRSTKTSQREQRTIHSSSGEEFGMLKIENREQLHQLQKEQRRQHRKSRDSRNSQDSR